MTTAPFLDLDIPTAIATISEGHCPHGHGPLNRDHHNSHTAWCNRCAWCSTCDAGWGVSRDDIGPYLERHRSMSPAITWIETIPLRS